ncbi:MAG: 50S ribosomal protein L24 [Breznakia sp.]
MRIKKGDKVKVITGRDKGTIAEVLHVIPSLNKLIVEGVNIKKKHLKPTQENPDGGIAEAEAAIHVSNVMAYDAKKKVASRISYIEEKGKKVRVYTKTGTIIK